MSRRTDACRCMTMRSLGEWDLNCWQLSPLRRCLFEHPPGDCGRNNCKSAAAGLSVNWISRKAMSFSCKRAPTILTTLRPARKPAKARKSRSASSAELPWISLWAKRKLKSNKSFFAFRSCSKMHWRNKKGRLEAKHQDALLQAEQLEQQFKSRVGTKDEGLRAEVARILQA